MPAFKITWDTGLETTEHRSDCHTVEQFINSRFGAGVKPTAKIELLGTEEPTKENPPTVKENPPAVKEPAKAKPKA